MAQQFTTPDKPAHTSGTLKGEESRKSHREQGREGKTPEARSSTGINAAQRAPIDPRMPHLPPA